MKRYKRIFKENDVQKFLFRGVTFYLEKGFQFQEYGFYYKGKAIAVPSIDDIEYDRFLKSLPNSEKRIIDDIVSDFENLNYNQRMRYVIHS